MTHPLSLRLQRLPAPTQELLRISACVGNRFALGTLARVAARPVDEVARALRDAIAEGLVIPLGCVHAHVEAGAASELEFRFAHERVQEAALAALDDDSRVRLHREVGRKLLEQLDAGEEMLFEVVEQLDRGAAAASDPAEAQEPAHLDPRAARKARLTEALDALADLLARIGFPLPEPAAPGAVAEEMRRTEEALAGCTIEDLVRLPRCTDEAARTALELLNRMLPLAITTSHPLVAPIVCKAVQISIAHGNTADSALAYTFYGVLLARTEDIDRAARFGRAAVALSDALGESGMRSFVYVYAHCRLIHWTLPLPEIVRHLLDAYRYATEAGSPHNAACAASSWCVVRFLAGDPLGEVAADLERHADVAVRFRQNIVKSWHDAVHQVVRNLFEETPHPTRLAGRFYDEETRLSESSDGGGLGIYHLLKVMLCYLFGDVERAVEHARAREPYAAVAANSLWEPILALWDSLARLALFQRSDEAERAQILERVAGHERKLEVALLHCPQTIAHKFALVQAERARVEGRGNDARTAFERAVALARASGYVHEEALACELSARFLLEKRETRAARSRFREAHKAYLRWGAVTKAKALERELPHLVPRAASVTFSPVAPTGTRGAEWDRNVVDPVSVINASQAISREVDRDRLLTRLMAVLIETGGAESGALLRERGGQWLVEAEKRLDEAQPSAASPSGNEDPRLRGRRGVPESVIHHVARTGEPLVVDDAMASPQLRRDPYIARHQVASILCFPLPRQSEPKGMVYLENNLMKGAFTPDRIKVLLLLSTQAVISLDNAVLYRTLEQRVEERTRELSAKNDELAAAMARLREAQDRLIVQDRLASLGTLAAGVAHELRNPLNFVNSFARLAEDMIQDAKVALDEVEAPGAGATSRGRLRPILDDIAFSMSRVQDNGRRMDGIISSMLEHSRGGQGERRATDLNGLVEKFASLAAQGLRSRTPPIDVSLELALDPSVGQLPIVPQEISRVLLNLIDNAAYAVNAKKAAGDPRYQPHVRIATRSDGDVVEIRVYDNGMGVPADIRDRLYNPFFTTKRPGEGTGLGLSICYDIIVKSNRGSIRCDSIEGEFTEFVIRLPRQLA
ncbi:ATP-binding protein [Sorangium sp. So ce134]